MRAVITLHFGLVENIISDEPLEVLVIDDDASLVDDKYGLTTLNVNGERVFVQFHDAEENETLVEDLFCRSLNGDNGEEGGEEN